MVVVVRGGVGSVVCVTLTGNDKGYALLHGGEEPGKRSMMQSHGQ